MKTIRDNKVYVTKSKTGPTKTSAGNRVVPYFGYFKPFPKSKHAVANKLQEYGVTIHSLRKTYAYFLKSNLVHVTAAAKFLGHSNPLITLRIYTLVRDEEIDEIRNHIQASNVGLDFPLLKTDETCARLYAKSKIKSVSAED